MVWYILLLGELVFKSARLMIYLTLRVCLIGYDVLLTILPRKRVSVLDSPILIN